MDFGKMNNINSIAKTATTINNKKKMKKKTTLKWNMIRDILALKQIENNINISRTYNLKIKS